MSFIRATYISGSIEAQDDNRQLATDQTIYWITGSSIANSLGVWDTENSKFIPDGWYDHDSGWLWPVDLDWSNYNAND